MQFGFRAKLSTADAVHHLTDFVSQEIGKGEQVMGIFLDLAKAFDTVSIPILLNKLDALGVRGKQLKLFASYLDERFQCVKIEGVVSDDQINTPFGVPQGSILGPTLFLIYINDLCNLNLEQGKIISYADDTALIFTAPNSRLLLEYAQKGFNIVNNWLRNNLLTLNADKTKFINFSLRSSYQSINTQSLFAHQCQNPSVDKCRCPEIEGASCVKYLGIILDNTLSFRPHIDLLVNRLRKLIYVFKKLRYIADPNLIKQVYLALAQSIIQYCITSWGGAQKTILLPLERAQRAILKVANFCPFLFPTQKLYDLCKVLTVRQLFIMHTVLKQHTGLPFDITISNKRRKDIVCPPYSASKLAFINRFNAFLAPLLYNRINRILNIYELNYFRCKQIVIDFLQNMTYEQTESLLVICK